MVFPAVGVAERFTVPVPHLAPGVPEGADGNGLIVIVISLDVAGEPVAQVAVEVIITFTISPSTKALFE